MTKDYNPPMPPVACIDREITTMAELWDKLSTFDRAERDRMLKWILNRHHTTPDPDKMKKRK